MSNNRIRVLHVAEAAGGVDRYLKALFKYMDRDQFENVFVCSQNFNKPSYEQLVDHVIQIPMSHEINRTADRQAISLIRKIIKQYNPDVVYGHSTKAGALLRLADMGIKNRVLYNPHGWSFNMRASTKMQNEYKWIEKVQVPFTDKIICISEAEKTSALREHICKEDKLVVINNGVDLDAIENAPRINRNDVGIPENGFIVGMVGRITEQKAPDIFIEAANLIKKRIPNAFFVIVGDTIAGDNTEKDLVNSLIGKYGLKDNVLITGWVDNPTAYMRLFNVGLLLSRWEGFGLVIPEFMACGVPIIATRVDAIPYLIKDGKNGLLIDMDDFNAITDAVIKLARDKDLREKIICNEKIDSAHRFNIKKTAKATEKMIEELTLFPENRGGGGNVR